MDSFQFLPQYAEFGEEAFGTGVKLEAWHLQLLAVDPQYQRKGIAKALIDTIKQKVSNSRHMDSDAVKPSIFYVGCFGRRIAHFGSGSRLQCLFYLYSYYIH